MEKAYHIELGNINKLVYTIFAEIKTSLTNTDILMLAKDVFSYKMGENACFQIL